ncbi:MAG: nitrous oxide-stimulated promoter family protein [Candidatus Riflebacteria bacterium]|nr:nitrous oxide-stimulated promoter family protein [Candidatus Riflebacteria bacterium]
MEVMMFFPCKDRLTREYRTIAAMIQIYCDHGHNRPETCQDKPSHEKNSRLCKTCFELKNIARTRLSRCPFGSDKPTCANCKIHCYSVESRKAVREVMRFAGPRLLFVRPLLALMHIIDGIRHRRF